MKHIVSLGGIPMPAIRASVTEEELLETIRNSEQRWYAATQGLIMEEVKAAAHARCNKSYKWARKRQAPHQEKILAQWDEYINAMIGHHPQHAAAVLCWELNRTREAMLFRRFLCSQEFVEYRHALREKEWGFSE